jgi:hypothetical protein
MYKKRKKLYVNIYIYSNFNYVLLGCKYTTCYFQCWDNNTVFTEDAQTGEDHPVYKLFELHSIILIFRCRRNLCYSMGSFL